MTDAVRPTPRVAIIGGGITGLAAAERLRALAPGARVTLFEAAPRLGGVLETRKHEGFLVEQSADNFLRSPPWGVEFAERVGAAESLIPTRRHGRGASVLHRGALHRVPAGFQLMAPGGIVSILTTRVLSLKGKLRLAREGSVAPGDPDVEESVAQFARRRLGDEAYERLVQPLMGGIYAGDAERLSLLATAPRFVEDERRHGSLTGAARHRRASGPRERGARYGLFVAPQGGMERLVDAAARAAGDAELRLNTPVGSLRQDGPGVWRLAGLQGEDLGAFDAVLVTTQAYHAADLLTPVDKPLAEELRGIEYSGVSVVCLGLRRRDVRRRAFGFGFVVPASEGRRILAASFSSRKFPGRAPDGTLLVRVFIGGALAPDLADLHDAGLTRIAVEELAALVGLRGAPLWSSVARWPRRMPQYHVGHLARVGRIEALAARRPGLELAGAAYRGVGVPQCIRDGELAAGRVADYLQRLAAASPERATRDTPSAETPSVKMPSPGMACPDRAE